MGVRQLKKAGLKNIPYILIFIGTFLLSACVAQGVMSEEETSNLKLTNFSYELMSSAKETDTQWLEWRAEITNTGKKEAVLGWVAPVLPDSLTRRVTKEYKTMIIEPLETGMHQIEGRIRIDMAEMTQEELEDLKHLKKGVQIDIQGKEKTLELE